MKGINTIILNAEQMNTVMTKWWSDMTYATKDKVIDVSVDGNGNFEVILDEIVETVEKEDR